MKRRRFLACAGATAISPLATRAAFALGMVKLGDAEISIVSDGTLTLPISFAYPDAPAEELKALLQSTGATGDALSPDCNVTIVKRGDRIAVFDVGSGPNFMPNAGKLVENLGEAGIDPAVVTDVVFTHAHPDHLWGLVDELDELVFPEAAYHMSSAEWDYWRAPDTLDKTPDARKAFVAGALSRFPKIEDRITLFGWGKEILPGVEAVDTSGHTAGHTSFVVHGGPESVMIVGDAITHAAISFGHPGWPSGSDHDAQKGIATRKMLLDRLAKDRSKIIGFHLPHPGSGMVEAKGDAYIFAPA
jgi:glyoxylase-like metal-dependent hydrolase (beta-lactamase superfamily II)